MYSIAVTKLPCCSSVMVWSENVEYVVKPPHKPTTKNKDNVCDDNDADNAPMANDPKALTIIVPQYDCIPNWAANKVMA